MVGVMHVDDYVRQRLKSVRIEKRYSVSELARKAGIPQSSYSCLETGSYRITLDNLHKIVGALEVDISRIWPSDIPKYQAVNEEAYLNRVQAFRIAELTNLTEADGVALFRLKKTTATASVLHHNLRDLFLLERLLLYAEDEREYSKGLWFYAEGKKEKLVFFINAEHISQHLQTLVGDYMEIWAGIYLD